MAPVGRLALAKVSVSPSGSDPVAMNVSARPSSTLRAPIVFSTGGRLMLPTVIVKVSESVCGGLPLSVTVIVTPLWLPVCPAVGVHEKAPAEVNLAPTGKLPAENVSTLESGSVAVALNASNCPTLVVCAPMGASTGGWLAPRTVIVNCALALCGGLPLSVTVIVTLG